MLKYICYPKCTTCQKAEKWLIDNGAEYELRDIKRNNPLFQSLPSGTKKAAFRSENFSTPPGFFINRSISKTSFLK